MTLYELAKYLHIVGAVAWVGSGIGLAVLAGQLRAARDLPGLMAFENHGEALGKLVFTPAALVTVVAGVGMVANNATIGFGDLWIVIGYVGIALSGVAQMAVAAPASRRFVTLAADHGIDHAETLAAGRRAGLGNLLDVGVLLVVIWAMVARPTL